MLAHGRAGLRVELRPHGLGHTILMTQDRDVVVDHDVVDVLAHLQVDFASIEFREHLVITAEDVEVPGAAAAQDAPLPALAIEKDDSVERHRRVGGKQDRVREVDVLVVAGREVDAELLQEVPPVDLVAGDRQQVEQAQVVARHEDRRRQRGENLIGPAHGGAAVPPHTGVVVDEQLRELAHGQTIRDGGE